MACRTATSKTIFVADAGDELLHQPRFPDTGFSDEADKLGRAAARLVKARQHSIELRTTTYHRRTEAERLEPTRCTRRR